MIQGSSNDDVGSKALGQHTLSIQTLMDLVLRGKDRQELNMRKGKQGAPKLDGMVHS